MSIELTAAQRTALEAEGDVLVRAAAGSGKTRVLTGRIVRAVVEQGVPLSAIVAVTFTEKAAEEIRDRVARQFVELGRHDQVAMLETAAIGTIHSLCARILREHAHSAGIDRGFSILDGAQSAYLSQQSFQLALEQASSDDASIQQLRLRYGDERVETYVMAAHEAAMQRLDGCVTFRAAAGATPLATTDANALQLLLQAFRCHYFEARRAANSLDFQDLEHHVVRLLHDDDVATQLRFGIQRVLVDEFQDTNELQCSILERLGRGCLFAVGDEWQSIYRFRKADVEVFRRRADALGDRVISMRDNFRSAPAVLDVVNHVFEHTFGAAYQPVLAGLAREPGDGNACEFIVVPGTGAAARAAEATAVASQVAELLEAGVQAGDVAILLARQTHAAVFEQALTTAGIPSLRAASRGYFGQQQVSDLTALLGWARNRLDDRAALAVLAAPYIDLQWQDMLRLRAAGPAICNELQHDDDPRCRKAYGLLEELEAVAANGTLVDVVEHALHATGYLNIVLAGTEGRRRVANMRKLVELAASAQGLGINDLGRFLDLVAAQRSLAAEGEANVAEEGAAAVRIMSIHASKGLEFPYVFVCDTANAGRSQRPTVLAGPEGDVHFVRSSPDGLELESPDELGELQELEQAAGAEEERRLLYVALTRAEHRLWVSGVYGSSRSTGEPRPTGPLAWLLPAFGIDLAKMQQGTPWRHATLPVGLRVIADAGTPIVAAPGGVLLEVEPSQPVQFACSDAPDLWEALRGAPSNRRHVAAGGDGLRSRHSDETALLLGRQVHGALARLLQPASLGIRESAFSRDVAGHAPAHVSTLVERVANSDVFRELLAAGGQAEVPWCATVDGDVAAGRFDALAIDDDCCWWIVDYKLSVPRSPAEAWSLHAAQLERYASAAFAGGASSVRLTLVPLDRPTEPLEWRRLPTDHVFEASQIGLLPGADAVDDPASQMTLEM